ncbi:MAG: response regulator [Alphaproteobacteria bacterium]
MTSVIKRKSTILVVDDAPENIDVIKSILTPHFTVKAATSGAMALKIVATQIPDLILLDILMPEMDGFEVCRRLKADDASRGVPVIFVSVLPDTQTKVKAFEAGAVDYVAKPFEPKEVLARVRTHITLKTAERELVRASYLASVGRLAAGIAHEINTPLQYITSNAKFILESFRDVSSVVDAYARLCDRCQSGDLRLEDIAEVKSLAETLDFNFLRQEIIAAADQSLTGADHVSRIVVSLKDFALPGSNARASTDINRAIRSTVSVSAKEWTGIADIVLNLKDDLPPAICLPVEINQVFLNLIVNAKEAIANVGRGMGTITIETRSDDDYVEVRISDSGAGIPMEIRDRVFEPFFTTKDTGTGIGLGLTVCYDIVTLKYAGQIIVDGESGKGATVAVRIPIDKTL